MNIKDMAHKAGVSVATISRAINPETRGKVAPKTLKAVDGLIRKYGYTPNLAARNLNKTSSKTIGVIFPYFEGIFQQGKKILPQRFISIVQALDFTLEEAQEFKRGFVESFGIEWRLEYEFTPQEVGLIRKGQGPMMIKPGGIDLNPASLSLVVKQEGKGIQLPIIQKKLDGIRIDGLVPFIRHIVPASSLLIFKVRT